MLEIRVHTHLSPRIVEILPPVTNVAILDLYRACRDWEDNDGMSYPKLISAGGGEDLGGDVSVSITATLQNAKLMFTQRHEALATGSVTLSNAVGIKLVDVNASFLSDGIVSGSTAYNQTTREMAPVLLIKDTELTTFPLSGSTFSSPGWTIGDEYIIFPNTQANIVVGNLVSVDLNGVAVESIFPSSNIQVIRSTATSAILQELDIVEFSSFNQGVTIDVTAPNVSIAFPTGTNQQPVNNLTDAKAIANFRGFSTFYILGDITFIASDNIDSFEIVGDSRIKTTVTVTAGCSTVKTEFLSCTLQGSITGAVSIKDCHIIDLDNLGSATEVTVIQDSLFEPNTFTVDSSATQLIFILDSATTASGHGGPTFDMNSSTVSMRIKNWTGGLAFSNCTDGTVIHSVEVNTGHVFALASCTAGSIVVHGISMITDLSTGTFSIDETGVENRFTIADQVWDEHMPDHLIPASTGGELYSGSGGGGLTAQQTADAVWDEPIQDHLTNFTTGGELYSGSAGIDAQATADAVWNADVDDHKVIGSFGQWFRKIFWGGKTNS